MINLFWLGAFISILCVLVYSFKKAAFFEKMNDQIGKFNSKIISKNLATKELGEIKEKLEIMLKE